MTKSVSLLLDRDDLYQRSLAQEASVRAARRGLDLKKPQYAEGSAVSQMEQLLAATKGDLRPDGVLLVTSGRESQLPACRRLVRAGASVVFLNRVPDYLDELRAENRDVLVAAVTPDQMEIGRLQAEQCRSVAPEGGVVLLITGTPSSASAIARREAFLGSVRSKGIDVHVLEGQWTEDSAYEALSDWYRLGARRGKSIQVVACQNDQMARGARRALVDHGGDTVGVSLLGCDGLVDEGQRMVQDGVLAGTIIMPSTSGRAIDLLAAFWEHGARADVVLLPPDAFPLLSEMRSA
jgi:ribose transport system substrate-binding protein